MLLVIFLRQLSIYSCPRKSFKYFVILTLVTFLLKGSILQKMKNGIKTSLAIAKFNKMIDPDLEASGHLQNDDNTIPK